MANEFVARKGLISLSTSSFYGPVNFSGSSLVGIGTGSVLFTDSSGSVTGSSNLVWDNVNGRLGIGTNAPTNVLDVVKSYNGETSINIKNTTSGNSSVASIYCISNTAAGSAQYGKISSAYTQYKTLAPSDAYLYNNTIAGDISILNDYVSGSIKLTAGGASVPSLTILPNSSVLIGTTTGSGYRLDVNGSGAASGSLRISGSTTQPVVVGNSLTSVNIVPTMVFTTGSQTQTAFKVMPTFSGSSTFTSSQTNIIADFGATSVGSQLIVTDVTSGSIYMVNDVSGIPIIEANSNWDVLMYDYPYTVFKKTGSVVELGALGQASSSVLFKSDLVINEGLGFSYRQSQVSASVAGAVTSSLYNLTFTNVSSSVYIQAVVTGYDTGSRDTITGDIKATIRYRAGAATIVGIDQSFVNSDNSVVGFDIVAGGTSGSLVAFGTGSRTYQFGATVTTQII